MKSPTHFAFIFTMCHGENFGNLHTQKFLAIPLNIHCMKEYVGSGSTVACIYMLDTVN